MTRSWESRRRTTHQHGINETRDTRMSKYEPLWKHLQADGSPKLQLSFDDIKAILGFSMDHSFLTYKKEAVAFGVQVGKISLKEKHVTFSKLG
jgi:hypothetical protein